MVLVEEEGVPINMEDQVSGPGRRGGSTCHHGEQGSTLNVERQVTSPDRRRGSTCQCGEPGKWC